MTPQIPQTSSEHAIFDDNYEIQRAVGRGRNSVVYQARKLNSDSRDAVVALKVLVGSAKLPSANVKRMKREALAMLACRHPNVIRLNDYVAVGELCYLSMEYADGGDLRALLETRGQALPLDLAFDLIIQTLFGLEAIHRAGVIHRDIKPENMLLSDGYNLKIADFGVAQLPVHELMIENAGLGVGTFDYLAPEALTGGMSDERSDIYSVAITLYQLLTNHLPFEGTSLSHQIEHKVQGLTLPLENFLPNPPRNLQTLLKIALANNPEERFQTASDFRRAIEEFRSGTWAADALIESSADNIDSAIESQNVEDDTAELQLEAAPQGRGFKKIAVITAGLLALIAVFAVYGLPHARGVFSSLKSYAFSEKGDKVPAQQRDASAEKAPVVTAKRGNEDSRSQTGQRAMLAPSNGLAGSVFSGERTGVLEHLFADGSDVQFATTPTNSRKIVVALGLIGWKPVEVDISALNANQELEVSGSGLKLLLKIENSDSDEGQVLSGTFRETISGREGRWRIW